MELIVKSIKYWLVKCEKTRVSWFYAQEVRFLLSYSNGAKFISRQMDLKGWETNRKHNRLFLSNTIVQMQ